MNKQKNFYILLLIVFFAFLGAAMPYAIFAPLFLHPTHNGLIHLNSNNNTRGLLLGLTLAMYPLGQFIGSPILGSLSDQLGRKKLLLITLIGTAFGYIATALAIQIHSISLLLISRLGTGFLEGNIAIAQAYIVDLKINKQKGLGAVGAVTAMGYIFGPPLAGILSSPSLIPWFNHTIPFYTTAIIVAGITILAWLILTETLVKTNSEIYTKHSLLTQFNIVKRFANLTHNVNLKWLLISGIFLYLGVDTFYEFYPVILVHRWSFTASNIAIVNIFLALPLSIGSYFLPNLLTKRWKPQIIMCVVTFIFIAMLFLFIMTHRAEFSYLQFILIGLSYGTASTMHSIFVSDNTSAHQQGEAMGLRWGFRMLGDAVICVVGGFLIAFATIIRIIIALCSVIFFLLIFYRLSKTLNLKYVTNHGGYDE